MSDLQAVFVRRKLGPRKPGGRRGVGMATLVRTALLAAGLTCMAVALVPASRAAGEAMGPKVPDGWTFELPDGDVAQGEAVFMKMRCFTCHVSRAQVPDAPTVATGTGPTLGPGYAALPKEYLAEAIIRAHKVVAAPGYEMKKHVAGMGNYNYFMTVDELINLVAYLKSGKEK
jgi:hypothetical protein